MVTRVVAAAIAASCTKGSRTPSITYTASAPACSARWARATMSSIGPSRERCTASFGMRRSRARAAPGAPIAPPDVRSVLALDDEVRPADGAGQLGLLPSELELAQLLRHVHPLGELESDRPLRFVAEAVHHVDRQTALVEHVGHLDVLDLERSCLERRRGDDDV